MTPDPSHASYDGLAGLYAIGGLNRVDRDRFEQHLETCYECVEAVRLLLPVAHGLSQAATPQEPPKRLRDRIVGREEDQVPLTRGRTTGSAVSSSGRISPVYRAMAVACLIVAGGLGWYAAQQVNLARQLRADLDGSALRIQVANLDAATARQNTDDLRARAEILAAPDVTTIALEGQPAAPDAIGRAFLSGTRGAVIAASNVPPLPPGQIYQVWFVIPPNPVAAGFARADAAGRILGMVSPPPGTEQPIAIAVTMEPEGGVDEPNGDVYLLGRTDR